MSHMKSIRSVPLSSWDSLDHFQDKHQCFLLERQLREHFQAIPSLVNRQGTRRHTLRELTGWGVTGLGVLDSIWPQRYHHIIFSWASEVMCVSFPCPQAVECLVTICIADPSLQFLAPKCFPCRIVMLWYIKILAIQKPWKMIFRMLRYSQSWR